ncbi:MMPL family transporter [Arcanobacterium hippocoleae]
MFTFLGKSVAKRPLVYVIIWCVLLTIGGISALSGFGEGNIFQRVESSTSLVPGSESDIVAQQQSVENLGENITAIVTGASFEKSKKTLAELRSELMRIQNVAEVLEPVKIDADFKNKLAIEKQKALTEALKEAEPQIQTAINQALTAQASQLAHLPAPIRSQTEAQIKTQVREKAAAQVKTEASRKIDAELAKIENPAANFLPAEDKNGTTGFAVVIRLKPGEHGTAHSKVTAVLHDYQKKLQQNEAKHAQVQIMSTTIIKNVILAQVTSDLIRGEIVGIPIALLLMVFVFGGILAAGLPLGSAIVTILISMGIIWGVTFTVNVDSFVLNILSIIGVALSIDYGLLVVSRYREIIHAEFAKLSPRKKRRNCTRMNWNLLFAILLLIR